MGLLLHMIDIFGKCTRDIEFKFFILSASIMIPQGGFKTMVSHVTYVNIGRRGATHGDGRKRYSKKHVIGSLVIIVKCTIKITTKYGEVKTKIKSIHLFPLHFRIGVITLPQATLNGSRNRIRRLCNGHAVAIEILISWYSLITGYTIACSQF